MNTASDGYHTKPWVSSVNVGKSVVVGCAYTYVCTVFPMDRVRPEEHGQW